MDTYMTIRAYDADDTLMSSLQTEIEDLEKLLSVTNSGSEIARINREKEGSVSERTEDVVRTALQFCEACGGAFDISVYPVVREWGFTTGEYQVPDPEKLKELLENVDYRQVQAENGSIRIGEKMEIDLGGIAKGYLGNLLMEKLHEGGVTSAIIDLGGNVVTSGKKPDGSLWKVAVRNPVGEEYVGYLELTDKAVVTSGGYERFFEDEDGNIWWHIIDPATGYPARNGLLSVTVVGEDAAYCDAMSTALFVMGKEKALEFRKEHEELGLVLVTDANEVILTENLAEIFVYNDVNDFTVTVAD